MFIDTTININRELLQEINIVASAYNISKNKLLALLLKEVLFNHPKNAVLFKQVSYQKRLPKKNWHKLHISLRCDLYEKALDLKKFSKLSVSFIFSNAISQYLQKVINKILKKNKTDNYPSQYIFSAKFYYNLPSFTVYHYYPGKKKLK